MARTFSATSDRLRFPVTGTQLTSGYSIGAWVKRASDGTNDTIISRCTSGNQARFALEINTSGRIVIEQTGVGERETPTLTVREADGWCFVAVTKASGSSIARAHVWKRASGWAHEDMGAALANAETAGSSATVRIGEWQGGTEDNFNGDIEVVVEYRSQSHSNTTWEAIAFSRTAMLAHANVVGLTALWELRQASVEQKVFDLCGTGMNESVRAGTSVSTRSCPFYSAGGPPLYTPTPTSTAVDIEAALRGTGDVSAEIRAAASIEAALAGTGGISAELKALANLEAALGGTGDVSVDGTAVAAIAGDLAGAGSLSAELRSLASIIANLIGTGDVSVELTALADIAAVLEGHGSLNAELSTIASLEAALLASGSLVALLETILPEPTLGGTRAALTTAGLRAAIAGGGSRAALQLTASSRATFTATPRTAVAFAVYAAPRATMDSGSQTRAARADVAESRATING
jgi:Concanavalin A-like lectin/glucanases superfamily